jgi:hypothetical protein
LNELQRPGFEQRYQTMQAQVRRRTLRRASETTS